MLTITVPVVFNIGIRYRLRHLSDNLNGDFLEECRQQI